MIAYRISIADLNMLIDKENVTWRTRASTRTQDFVAAGCYDEPSSIWSEIKIVYMRLQGDSKCVFCERKLESEAHGLGEQDVEHFRPKKGLKAWRVPAALTKAGVTLTAVPTNHGGYYALAYHPFNYAASCKPCNSALKGDRFPIAGQRNTSGSDPGQLATELPLLVYPVGDFDTDPEHLIEFHGISPVARVPSGHDRHRGLVAIAFFRLDDAVKRKNLMLERARLLVGLFPYLEAQTHLDPSERLLATQFVRSATSPKAPHASCAHSFVRLHKSDPDGAKRLRDAAAAFVLSAS
jgi:hypothetical protein